MDKIKKILEDISANGNMYKRKDVLALAEEIGLEYRETCKHFLRPEMSSGVRGVYDISLYDSTGSKTKVTKVKKSAKGSTNPVVTSSGRKVYKIEDKPEVYPGVYFWNSKTFILVKDGEHYPIPTKKMDEMVAECKGHHEEIVKYFKPRVKKARDPNAPKIVRKKKEEVTSESIGIQSTSTWVAPEFQDKKDGHKYNEMGFRIS